jgi:O-antigen/teichoic acid export membrane protein
MAFKLGDTLLHNSVLPRLRNRRFWHASGLLMLANGIVLGLGLIRTPAMTWILPKYQVGMIGVVAAWMPFLQLLSLSGLDSASYHYVAIGQPWAFAVNLIHRRRWSLLSSAGLLIGALYWWWQGDAPLAWMFVTAGLSFPVTEALTACGSMLGAQENFTGLFWYRLGESLTDFAGFLPLLLSMWWVNQVITFYAVNQAATALMLIAVAALILRQLRRGQHPSPTQEAKREMVRYGKHLTAINSISVVQSRIDAVLIALFFPLTVVADYTIALLVQAQFKRLWNVYVTVRYPPLVRLSQARRRRRLLIEGLVILLGFAALGGITAVVAHWLIPVLLPKVYASSLPYINLLIATVIAGVPGGLAELGFKMVQDERKQYISRGISALAGTIAPLLMLFLLDWGATGVIVGRLIGNVVFSITGTWIFLRQRT